MTLYDKNLHNSRNHKRLEWLFHNNYTKEQFGNKYSITAWLCEGVLGNKGCAGLFVTYGENYSECIDKFLNGDVLEVD